jgi:hypothetical protein
LLKTPLTSLVTGCLVLGFSAQAHAWIGMNGGGGNGVKQNGFINNGIKQNGITRNGGGLNGMASSTDAFVIETVELPIAR